MAAKQPAGHTDRIVSDPEIMMGKPVIRGTRITVEFVLGFLAREPDSGQLLAAYPHLTLDDVQACLTYAEALVRKDWKASPHHITHAQNAGA